VLLHVGADGRPEILRWERHGGVGGLDEHEVEGGPMFNI
jgi:hypothetical protein